MMKTSIALAALFLCLCACGGAGGGGSVPAPGPRPSSSPVPFLPLAAGDTWTYACTLGTPAPSASTFPKTNQVLGTTTVGGTTVFEYAEQIPSSPTQSSTVIQLLADDPAGDTLIYGYMANPSSSPAPLASPVVIIAASPGVAGTIYDYPGENGGTISRFFWGSEPTHPTVFGTFQVDAYFEGSHVAAQATDGYGYAAGLGVMEEDHDFANPDPSKRIDCLITSTPAP